MSSNRVLLKVKRYKQRPSECASAAVATLANFYKPEIDYKQVRKLTHEMFPDSTGSGLFTAEQTQLLNRLGFTDITIVTADLKVVDFAWRNLSTEKLLDKLKRFRNYHRRHQLTDASNYESYLVSASIVKWLQAPGNNNQLIIDYEFPKYIRKCLDAGRPVGAAFNWTSLFKKGKGNDIWGSPEIHAIVIRGYDEKNIYIVDSHHQFYKGRLKKYASGFYKLSWENFLVNVPAGDLILIN